MSNDLETLLREWPFDPSGPKARLVPGQDGRPKIQLRVELGVLQMEMTGRPDGLIPHGCESLLDHYEQQARKTKLHGQATIFNLSADDCMKLKQEASHYYHRYVALFQLQYFEEVIRDAQRNLRLFDFVAEHASNPDIVPLFQQYRPHVLMTLTLARAHLATQNKDFTLALKHIDWGIQEIETFVKEHLSPDILEPCNEIKFLQNWKLELSVHRPLTPREKLQRQMNDAVRDENYEKAARLRDALRELQ